MHTYFTNSLKISQRSEKLFKEAQQLNEISTMSPLYSFTSKEPFLNSLGDHARDSVGIKEQVITIKKIILHAKYDPTTDDNDIAMIELSRPAVLNMYVNTICLPHFLDLEFPGKICTITGWGKTGSNESSASNILKKVNVPIINYGICNHEKSYKGRLTGNMFCAGYVNGSADTCQGDSGGPLQCNSKRTGKWVLNGITSWGEGCGTKHKYGVYVIVRHYLPWIKKFISGSPTLVPPPPIPKSPKIPPIPPSHKVPPTPLSSKMPPISFSSNALLTPTKRATKGILKKSIFSSNGKNYSCYHFHKDKIVSFLICRNTSDRK